MPNPKYETIRPFSPLDFILAHQKDCEKERRSNDCVDFKNDLRWFFDELSSGNPFRKSAGIHECNYFRNNSEFRKYLVKYDFVREVPEATYRVNDRFKHRDGSEYILAAPGNGLRVLISLKNGIFFSDMKSFGTGTALTQADFDSICCDKAYQFTRIEKD